MGLLFAWLSDGGGWCVVICMSVRDFLSLTRLDYGQVALSEVFDLLSLWNFCSTLT